MKKMKHANRLIIVSVITLSLSLLRCSTAQQAKTTPPESGSSTGAISAAAGQDANPENPQPPEGASGNLQESENPVELMEQALETYQDALTAREKGDNDSALESLDEAYGIIVRLKVSQDSSLFQEKNDLRLMIAQRIREIYTSHQIEVINNHKSIPLAENQYVLAEIKSFQTKEKEYFLEGYKRSGRYREMILLELKNAGLPDELSWIPMIESWFKVRAYSKARALGLWQFISSTGYRFGLKRDRWVDERMDPAKSTRAAVKYLNELHDLFGDWTTALASYNCGEFQVQRVIRNQRLNYLDNFWDLFVMLPRETARFVPRFIATLLIIQDPGKYGFELPEPDPPITYEIVLVNRPVKLSTLSRSLGLGEDDLADINPELRHNATPALDYHLKVPVGSGRQALAAFQNLSQWIPPEASYTIHRVQRGETVSGIARRYRTSISAIARLNRLRHNYMIRPGQRLKIPSRSSRF
jgi:membrane-bound lytic murein transglycosylase D